MQPDTLKKQDSVSILLVEDDDSIRETLSEVFMKQGYRSFSCASGEKALEYFERYSVDLVLLDLRLPGKSGLELLKEIKELDEELPIIVMTAFPEIKTAITAIKVGAYDYINKPFELDELKLCVKRALETRSLKSKLLTLQLQKEESDTGNLILGNGPKVNELLEMVGKVSTTSNTPVLIIGESGVGKELVAHAIHDMSDRKDKPFVKVNCSALPEFLLESELFGYEKGAFTDAKSVKKGIFELANSGTIFLDEIGEIRLTLQPKLLQVLEAQTFRKVGGVRDVRVDVRIVAATNQSLKGMVDEGRFRQDLYYRLNVFTIQVPSLRERKEDIMLMAEAFLIRNNRNLGKDIKGFSGEVRETLLSYDWPGNVRELKNIIERACILASGSLIRLENIPSELRKDSLAVGHHAERGPEEFSFGRGKFMPLEDVQQRYIIDVLASVNNNKSAAARILGISRFTLREKLKKINRSFEDSLS